MCLSSSTASGENPSLKTTPYLILQALSAGEGAELAIKIEVPQMFSLPDSPRKQGESLR